MAAGSAKPLTERQKRRIARVVDSAENETGLQFSVYVGPVEGDPHVLADELATRLSIAARPAVLLLVEPEQRRFELIPSGAAAGRIDERQLVLAAAAMRASFGVGDVTGGVCEAVRLLAQAAGPPTAETAGVPAVELPDLVEPV